ncbi:MAG: deoxynucleoside kinase [Patescibacteria group bacterium]
MKKGKLIVIDGIDGSGKNTQANLLIEALKKKKIKYKYLDFPRYDEFFGKLVKRYLNGDFKKLGNNPYFSSIFYAFDRMDIAEKIDKWIKQGYFIISNRYAEANLIHQAIKIKNKKEKEEFIDWIGDFEFNKLGIPKADIVIYLNVPPDAALKLIEKRGDVKDIHENKEHLEQAYKNAKWLSKKYKWILINCVEKGSMMPIEKIHKIILKKLSL